MTPSERRPRPQLWLVLALAFCSAAALGLLVIRNRATGSPSHRYLVWNLFLAWIPIGAALLADRWARRRVAFVLVAAGWLVFFPNAPYLVTDLIHLRADAQVPLWYDALLFASFALSGVLLGNSSIYLIQAAVRRTWGGVASWLVAGASMALGGYGVYLGRVERWNSWDLWTRPTVLLHAAAKPVLDPFGNTRAIAMSVMFFGFLLTAYLTMYAFADLHRHANVPPGVSAD